MNYSLQLHLSTTLAVVLVLAALGQAQTFTTLYNFTGGSDGSAPEAGVIRDVADNLYGTAFYGGDQNCKTPYRGCGVVYKLDTAGKETVLHTFAGYPSDGANPYTPLIRDKAGNIYGTTNLGGSNCSFGYGCGTVFKIDSSGSEKVLHNFTSGSDGCYPLQGLVMDKGGNLYGTSSQCGSANGGAIFSVDSAGKLTVLHGFTGTSSDGAIPQYGHLTMDKSGNLYGVTGGGGSAACSGGCGVLYKLSKNRTFKLLHRFAGGTSDGCYPLGSVVQDSSGNFYGTTANCGSDISGTIWKVSKNGKETILHNFTGSDGAAPFAGVARDSKGNLYGVTYTGGAYGEGVLYKLSASRRLTLLHTFSYLEGCFPYGEALRTTKGTLFGTTLGGGICNPGTVWSYAP
jgi:uncharacterized repeat protein (TIGR03803 family)